MSTLITTLPTPDTASPVEVSTRPAGPTPGGDLLPAIPHVVRCPCGTRIYPASARTGEGRPVLAAQALCWNPDTGFNELHVVQDCPHCARALDWAWLAECLEFGWRTAHYHFDTGQPVRLIQTLPYTMLTLYAGLTGVVSRRLAAEPPAYVVELDIAPGFAVEVVCRESELEELEMGSEP